LYYRCLLQNIQSLSYTNLTICMAAVVISSLWYGYMNLKHDFLLLLFYYNGITNRVSTSLWSLPSTTEWLDKRCWYLLTVAIGNSLCWWWFQWCCNCRRAFWSSNGMPCSYSTIFFFFLVFKFNTFCFQLMVIVFHDIPWTEAYYYNSSASSSFPVRGKAQKKLEVPFH
jgi:hypothetical protein